MDLIYIAYQRKVKSLNLGMKKVPAGCDIECIHRIRLDIKRIRVMLHLIEILVPEKFNAVSRYSHFRNLFRDAGKIREIQLEIKALDQHPSSGSMVFPFKKYLLKEEKKATQDLMKVVEKTDIKKFRKIENKIRKLSKKISINEFSDKTFGYLLSEAGIISNLMGLPDEAEQMHQIRQSLKSMGNVIALVAPVFPSKEMDSMARKIKVIDRLIGSCHDHFVLLSALEKFTRHHEGKENETVSSLKSFSLLMRSEYEALAKSLNPKIKSQLTNLLGILVKTIPVQISIRHASPLLQ